MKRTSAAVREVRSKAEERAEVSASASACARARWATGSKRTCDGATEPDFRRDRSELVESGEGGSLRSVPRVAVAAPELDDVAEDLLRERGERAAEGRAALGFARE